MDYWDPYTAAFLPSKAGQAALAVDVCASQTIESSLAIKGFKV